MNTLIQFVRELVQELQGKLSQFIQRINENKLTTAGILLTFSFTSLAAIILNDGFENGTTGWNTSGNVTTTYTDVYQNFYQPDYMGWRVRAYESSMAKLDSEVASSSIAALDTLFHLNAGSLATLFPDAVNGVGIAQTFTPTENGTIQQSALLGQRDLGDKGCAVLATGGAIVASQVLTAGAGAVGGGWVNINFGNYSLSSGTEYTIGFCTVNDDEYIGSTLYVDNMAGTETIPEPAIIALFGIGLTGLTWYRRKKSWV